MSQTEGKTATKCCAECGNRYQPGRKFESDFCGPSCRSAFNNRRMQRGAELYDLFMALRYERGVAKVYGLWSLVCKMAFVWKQEDERERAGRASYRSYAAIKHRFSRYQSVVLVRSKSA